MSCCMPALPKTPQARASQYHNMCGCQPCTGHTQHDETGKSMHTCAAWLLWAPDPLGANCSQAPDPLGTHCNHGQTWVMNSSPSLVRREQATPWSSRPGWAPAQHPGCSAPALALCVLFSDHTALRTFLDPRSQGRASTQCTCQCAHANRIGLPQTRRALCSSPLRWRGVTQPMLLRHPSQRCLMPHNTCAAAANSTHLPQPSATDRGRCCAAPHCGEGRGDTAHSDSEPPNHGGQQHNTSPCSALALLATHHHQQTGGSRAASQVTAQHLTVVGEVVVSGGSGVHPLPPL